MWRVLGPMQALFNNLSRVGRVRAAAQQFDMLMHLRGERLPSEMRAHFNAVRGHIELSRVSFRYSMNADPAVVGVTLDLPAGSMTAVTGANGSGKSTLLKLLLASCCSRLARWAACRAPPCWSATGKGVFGTFTSRAPGQFWTFTTAPLGA